MTGSDPKRSWVLACGNRYWPDSASAIEKLPMNHVPLGDDVPGELICVKVPDWAGDIAVDGNLLAYSGCLSGDPSARSDWRRFDWIAVAWHMLNGTSERAHEQRNGPVLSYAFRLPEELHLLFDRAWANRIFLFLRRWAAREERMSEEQLFGTVPKAEIVLTHDVDAIRLTPEIRLKQTAFQLANALRSATHARFLQAGVRLVDAARFAFSPGDLRTIGRIREMEQAAGLRSVFHFYGGPAGWARRTPRRMLIDPGYDVGSPYVAGEIGALRDGGWQVGLHQSFEAWSSPASMERERQRVEAVSGAPVVHCRQHWLRFSWETTWRAQERAGLAVDSTLGFNDRPGFRAGHALRLFPWDRAAGIPMQLAVMPMVMMDSQFYDYAQLSADAAGPGMKRWIDEIRAVGGEASVNWHPHTITGLYGWGKGFEDLLGLLS